MPLRAASGMMAWFSRPSAGLPGQGPGQRGARPRPMAFHSILPVHGGILLRLLTKPLCDGAFLGLWMQAALRVFLR
jgi:hypothetical protein